MRIPHLKKLFHSKVLLKNNHTVQEVLTEHVLRTAEANEFELIFVYTFSNQSIVNHLSTLFRQLLVPRSTTRSLISITGNSVLLIRVSLQDLGGQLDINLAVVIQTSAANLEEDSTRASYLNFLNDFLNLGLNISQGVLGIGQICLSLLQFASVLVDFVIQRINIHLGNIRNKLLATESIRCTDTYIDTSNSLSRRQVTQIRRSQFTTSFNVDIPVFVNIEFTLQTDRTVDINMAFLVTGRNASPSVLTSLHRYAVCCFSNCETWTCEYRQIKQSIRVISPNGIGEIIHSIKTNLTYVFIIIFSYTY